MAQKERESNLELLRVILMFTIVAHHSVVNSGILELTNFADDCIKTLFLQIWGMWGKTAINVFVLITGYYMCKSQITLKKFLKLLLEVLFYNFVILTIFICTGNDMITFKTIFKDFFAVFCGINVGFTASYLFFYLCIPYLNILLKNINKKQHIKIILLMLLIYTIPATFFFNSSAYTYIGWFTELYFIGSYIRMYPNDLTESYVKGRKWFLISVVISVASIVVLDILNNILNIEFPVYHFLADSNKILALIVGIFAFLTFKNLKMKNSKFINGISATTFGILLIHSNSMTMINWLWHDFLDIKSKYYWGTLKLVIYMIFITVLVFVVCSILDYIRIKVLEKPFFKMLDSVTSNRKVEKV